MAILLSFVPLVFSLGNIKVPPPLPRPAIGYMTILHYQSKPNGGMDTSHLEQPLGDELRQSSRTISQHRIVGASEDIHLGSLWGDVRERTGRVNCER